jgi:hypothetical protein
MAIRIAACHFRIASPTKVDRALTKPSTARFRSHTGNQDAALPHQQKPLCLQIAAGNCGSTGCETLRERCSAVGVADNLA